MKPSDPLPEVFSDWLESVDLPVLMSDIWRALCSTIAAQDSGYDKEAYTLNDKHKDVLADLHQHGYVALSMTQQASFFSQSATGIFNRSLDGMISEAITMVDQANQSKSENDDGGTR